MPLDHGKLYYFLDRRESQSILDGETLKALTDARRHELVNKSLKLSDREMDTILGLMQQFADLHESTGGAT